MATQTKRNTTKTVKQINHLVIATSSRALFNLSESHQIYKTKGVEAYRCSQEKNEKKILTPGVGFMMIKKLLNLSSEETPIDVVLLSRNSAETGLRVFNSIAHYKLNITRAAFTRGAPVSDYLRAFKSDLFLSSNYKDVKTALNSGFAAADIVMSKTKKCANKSKQLRIAFDGDAVIFSDEAETVHQVSGLDAFEKSEQKSANMPLNPGPFKAFLESLQKLQSTFPEENNPIRTALVTARSTKTQKRVIHTMKKWGIRIDETFFLGGMDKAEILEAFAADIFFDDQKQHCQNTKDSVSTAHVPFGVMN